MYQHRIALLEDNTDLNDDVCFLLRAEGFQIEGFGTASSSTCLTRTAGGRAG